MTISSLLNIGLSGLTANQKAIRVTGHNIANVNTPGYSRQEALLATYPETWFGDGYFGAGVQVAGVRRIFDQFQIDRLNADTAAAGQLRSYHQLAAELEDLLGAAGTELSAPLQGFFDALSAVAADPASIAPRQVLLGRAEALAGRIRALDGRMQEMRSGLQTRLSDTVAEINTLASGIAGLNQEIAAARVGRGQPNDLLDRRDALVARLAEKVGVTTVEQDNGMLNVFIGNGLNLVLGTTANRLGVEASGSDPQRVEVTLLHVAGSVPITEQLQGGVLGGLLDFDRTLLGEAEAQLGRLAIGLTMAVNAQHASGMNLRGEIGGLLFSDANSAALQDVRVSADQRNTGSAALTVTVDDPAQLGTSDYRLAYDGTQYTLMRLADETVVGTFAGFPQSIAGEGFTIDLASGAPAAGDTFLIRPTAGASREMRLLLGDPEEFAAAVPVRSTADAGNGGTAQVTALSAQNLSGTALGTPVTLTYDAGSQAFVVSNPPGGSLGYDPATDAGTPLTLSVPGFGDVVIEFQGSPAQGDQFVVESNAGGVGDNRNALALAALQETPLFNGGTATPGAAYGQLVSAVGVRTSSAELARDAQEALLRRSQEARDATSGVNLDEEAANLLRFQQAYQASAQVVAAANQMFQTLLSAFGG